MNNRRQTIRGAGSVRNDGVRLGIVFVLVDAHDDRGAIAFGRSGNDNLFGAGSEMALGLLDVGEQTGGFDNEVHAHLLPGQL